MIAWWLAVGVACSGGKDSGGAGRADSEDTGGDTGDTGAADPPAVWLERQELGFIVHVAGRLEEIEVRADGATRPLEAEEGGARAVVTVPSPREVALEVSRGGEVIDARTALVLEFVADGWGQPEVVGGMVNTPAWEDGASISADGQWLFLQYLPVSPSCLIEADADACTTVLGPSAAPERPGMAGAERIEGDTLVNTCEGLGWDEDFLASYGVYLPPSTLYGFHRQPDGTFADPFPVRFEGGSGCLYPTGPQLLDNGELLFTWDNPLASGDDTEMDFVTAPITLGEPLILGEVQGVHLVNNVWSYVEDPQRPGRQGNPGAVEEGGALSAIFFDDELSERVIYVQERSEGGWGAPARLPFTDPEGDIMPHWDGERLWFRRGYEIWSVDFLGGDAWTSARAWAPPERVLGADPTRINTPDAVFTLGEPTKTRPTDGSPAELYFLYGVRRGDGWMDFGVARVAELRP